MMSRRLRLSLIAPLSFTLKACTSVVGSSAAPRGRYCSEKVIATADTTFDAETRQEQGGTRLLSRDAPRFPNDMREQNIEGRATTTFIIDTTGAVVLGTAIITQESRLEFASAVCMWFRGKPRFEPLTVNGRRDSVRIVNLAFDFTLNRAS